MKRLCSLSPTKSTSHLVGCPVSVLCHYLRKQSAALIRQMTNRTTSSSGTADGDGAAGAVDAGGNADGFTGFRVRKWMKSSGDSISRQKC